ncbi:hypothetical protein [Mycolicibacterium sp. XJ1819]
MSQPDPDQDAAQEAPQDEPTSESATPAAVETTASEAAQRPGPVAAAAVLAFILAAYEIISGLLLVGAAFVSDTSAGMAILYAAVGILHVAFGALLVWGGLAALRGGTGSRLLLFTAAAASIAIAIAAVINIAGGELPGQLLFLLIYGALVYLLLRPESKRYLTGTR